MAKSQSHICRQRASEDSNLGLGVHLKRQQAQPEAGPSLCHEETRAQLHEQDKVRPAGASWELQKLESHMGRGLCKALGTEVPYNLRIIGFVWGLQLLVVITVVYRALLQQEELVQQSDLLTGH